MKKIAWAKFRSPFTTPGNSSQECGNNLPTKLNVNEEYKEAFRTKSYIEISSKVQGQLKRISISRLSSSSSSLPNLCMNLSDSLLEPRQETLMDMTETLDLHHLLVDYFKFSLEACDVCELLLRSIHQTRKNHGKIRRVIKLTKRLQCCTTDCSDDQCHVILKELASFALLKNPLSVIPPLQFDELRGSNMVLLRMLTSESKKIKRKAKFIRFCKKAGGCGLVVSHSAIVAALLVIALHSVVGIIAAPGLMACSFNLLKRKNRVSQKRGGFKTKTSLLEKLGKQLEVAAKGVYILMNDFNTMSRLVSRLQDEVEHRRDIAELCVRNGRYEVLKEVVKEFFTHETCFLEQLEELEQHIYLCFLTINRSRRLVLQEILEDQQ